jgi:peptidoglycan/xylan/chitin deacetylase (PgdA/CDA1 family)
MFTLGIGGSFPPDIFRAHVEEANRIGKLTSISDGLKQHHSGNINDPLISFWFDDGFVGVRKYAFPVLDKYGVKGAISVCSKFLLREELFWRLKLSFISQTDGLRYLRSRLRKYGYTNDLSVKNYVMSSFSKDIVNEIDAVYHSLTTELDRVDAFRLFDDVEGIGTLYRNGWEIANHSASHYPVGENTGIQDFTQDYLECEEEISTHYGINTKCWVVPFSIDDFLSDKLIEAFKTVNTEKRWLVFVGNKINIGSHRAIYRISVPRLGGKELIKYLKAVPTQV